MKIGKSVKDVPNSTGGRNWGKYGAIWQAVIALPNGNWLPVSFDTDKEANNFYLSAITHRTITLRAKRRLKTVYVQRKDAEE